MRLFEKIVIPVEQGSRAHALLKTATGLARQFGSEFILIHVNPLGAGSAQTPARTRELRRRLEGWSNTLIEAGAGTVTILMREGSPALHIEQVALDCKATMILLAEDAETSEARAWFGTTTQKLTRRLPTPLLVIRSDNRPNLDPILAVVDFSDASRRALHHAIDLARGLECRLTILHVVPDALRTPLEEGSVWSMGAAVPAVSGRQGQRGVPDLSYDLLTRSHAEAEVKLDSARTELRDFLATFDLAFVTHDSIVTSGAPVTQTLTLARSLNTGLIVTGSGPRTGVANIMSQTTAETLAELSDIPVMIFHSHSDRQSTKQERAVSRPHYI